MLTNLVNCDFERLRIGQRVTVRLMPAEGGRAIPCFEPAAGGPT
jgi:hypothetical protein